MSLRYWLNISDKTTVQDLTDDQIRELLNVVDNMLLGMAREEKEMDVPQTGKKSIENSINCDYMVTGRHLRLVHLGMSQKKNLWAGEGKKNL